MDFHLHNSLAEDAFTACRAGFYRDQGRALNANETTVAQRAAELAVEWSATQPVDRFRPETIASRVRRTFDRRAERKARRLKKREERAAVRDCQAYIEANWRPRPEDGVGFIILSLIASVIWHLIVVLIVRWLLKQYFTTPALADRVCNGGDE